MVAIQQDTPQEWRKRGPYKLTDGREHRMIAVRIRPEIVEQLTQLAQAGASAGSRARLIGDLVEEALIARNT